VDTFKGLLTEVAQHLSSHAEMTGLKRREKRVGELILSEQEGSLWKRIMNILGGEPDIIRDVAAPAIREGLAAEKESSFFERRNEFERREILSALEAEKWNHLKAAERLKIECSTMNQIMKRLSIAPPQ